MPLMAGRLVFARVSIRKFTLPPPPGPAVRRIVFTPATVTRIRLPLTSGRGTHANVSQPPLLTKLNVPILVVGCEEVPQPPLTRSSEAVNAPPPSATRREAL